MPSPLRPYRQEIINLRDDEKTLDQIARYLAQEYSLDASEEDIRKVLAQDSPPPTHDPSDP